MINTKFEFVVLVSNNSNHLIVCKNISSHSFRHKVIEKLFTYKPYIYKGFGIK